MPKSKILILKKIENLKREIEELEEAILEEKPVELREIPIDEAKKLILDYIDRNPGCYTDDIIFDLQLDPILVVKALKELEEEGKVEGR